MSILLTRASPASRASLSRDPCPRASVQSRGDDLPREAVLVFEPAALTLSPLQRASATARRFRLRLAVHGNEIASVKLNSGHRSRDELLPVQLESMVITSPTGPGDLRCTGSPHRPSNSEDGDVELHRLLGFVTNQRHVRIFCICCPPAVLARSTLRAVSPRFALMIGGIAAFVFGLALLVPPSTLAGFGLPVSTEAGFFRATSAPRSSASASSIGWRETRQARHCVPS